MKSKLPPKRHMQSNSPEVAALPQNVRRVVERLLAEQSSIVVAMQREVDELKDRVDILEKRREETVAVSDDDDAGGPREIE